MKIPTEKEQRKNKFLATHKKLSSIDARNYLGKIKNILINDLSGDSISFRIYQLDSMNHHSSVKVSISYNHHIKDIILVDERGVTYSHDEAIELLSKTYKQIPQQEIEERKKKLKALIS